MRKLLIVSVFIALLCLAFASASDAAYRIGGNWQTEGGGFLEKSFIRVSLSNYGRLEVLSTVTDGTERITGYRVWGELTASGLDVNAWDYQNDITLRVPIPVENFNPSMSEPFEIPPFTIDKLTYRVSLTSVYSGTVRLTGYVDIDGVGECEVKATNAIWKQGTPKPEIPDEESGCNAGAGLCALPALFALFLARRPKTP